jgi:hypothetical protein
MKTTALPVATWLAALSLALLVSLPAPTAFAEEETPGWIDVKAHLDPIQRTLDGLKAPPRDAGHDGMVGGAWKEFFKRRISRMRRRVKELPSKSVWSYDAQTKLGIGIQPKSWTPFLKNATSLHTELAICEEGHRKTRVTPDRALWFWKRRNPGPDPIGPVPGEAALAEVNRTIRELQAQGLPVSAQLWASRNRLQRIVWEEQELAREQKRREYEEREQLAAAEIARSVDATRLRLTDIADELAEARRLIRALVASAQEAEESRLGSLVVKTSDDAAFQREADKLLKDMAKGRLRTVDFDDSRHSKYLGYIQQKWMVPRAKLGKLIDKIAKAAKAAEAAAE